jgi:hypothetical protein
VFAIVINGTYLLELGMLEAVWGGRTSLGRLHISQLVRGSYRGACIFRQNVFDHVSPQQSSHWWQTPAMIDALRQAERCRAQAGAERQGTPDATVCTLSQTMAVC